MPRYHNLNDSEIYENNLNDYSRYYVDEDNGDHYMIRNPNYPHDNQDGYSYEYKDKNGNIITKDLEKYSVFFDEDGNEYRNTIIKRSDSDSDKRSSTPDMPAPVAPQSVNKQVVQQQVALMQPVTDGVVKHSRLPTTVSMKSITPVQMMYTRPELLPINNYVLYNDMPTVMNFRPNKPTNSRSFNSTNKKFINLTVDGNTLSTVTIGNYQFNIGRMIGKSRAIMYEIESSNLGINIPLCIKIAKHGNIVFNQRKLQHIAEYNNDFANVYYYFANVNFDTDLTLNGTKLGNSIDICVLEKTTTTLDKLFEDLKGKNIFSVKAFSFKFLSYLTWRLIKIANNLISRGLCYTDMKAENIGLSSDRINQHLYIKLIDVDTIDVAAHTSTVTTSGRIAPNINIIRMQYLNIFFTIISLLFLDNSNHMCSNTYSQYYVGSEMHNYMNWFDATNNDIVYNSWLSKPTNVECIQYKYALLVGTYKIIDDFFGGNPRFTLADIYNQYWDIVRRVCDVILNKDRCRQDENGCNIITDVCDNREYFSFIAQCLVIMVAMFKCPPNAVPEVVNKLLNAPYDNTFKSYNDLFDDVMLDAETSIGVSITNILRRYTVGYCTDEICSNLKEYGQTFLNIDNNINEQGWAYY